MCSTNFSHFSLTSQNSSFHHVIQAAERSRVSAVDTRCVPAEPRDYERNAKSLSVQMSLSLALLAFEECSRKTNNNNNNMCDGIHGREVEREFTEKSLKRKKEQTEIGQGVHAFMSN
jgi:hypothetical protein